MPPQLALGLTTVLIFWLFRRDMRLRELSSPALWIPAAWLVQTGSRPVSAWLAAIGINAGESIPYSMSVPHSNIEGSPLDMAVFLALIVAAVVVLNRRAFDWPAFAQTNKALVVIYLYLILSALWSEYSMPTFKRALKDFGGVLVALVFLTEVDPLAAIRIVYVRLSYVLFPLSVVFIKYFPDIGRIASRGGSYLFTGVCTHKNTLGVLVFVLGLFLVIDLWMMRQQPEGRQKTDEWIRYGMLAIGLWLLFTCSSMTSLTCLTLGCLFFWGTGRLLRMQDPSRMLFRCLATIVCVAVLEFGFDVSGMVLNLLGRDKTMTGRTEIWEMVEQTNTDPLIGCGFYSFWNTEGAKEISALFKGTLSTVHNGFLEMYLDGGAIGLGLLILLLLTWGRRSVQRMLEGTVLGRLALCFWVLAVIYNFSETDFFRLETLWFTLLVMMVECPPSRQARTEDSPLESAADLHTARSPAI